MQKFVAREKRLAKVPRRIAVLRMLEQHGGDARLCDLLLSFGRTDRIAQAIVVSVLLQLRRDGHVTCKEGDHNAKTYGRVYNITPEGSSYLIDALRANVDWADAMEPESPSTGSMAGETALITRLSATDAPRIVFSGPHWAFGPLPVKLFAPSRHSSSVRL
jgi:hypothetical protein